jgi:hypothetical protein
VSHLILPRRWCGQHGHQCLRCTQRSRNPSLSDLRELATLVISLPLRYGHADLKLTAAVMPAVPAPLQKWSVERSITAPAIINYRIATLVFWHVAFRRMRAEAKLSVSYSPQ